MKAEPAAIGAIAAALLSAASLVVFGDELSDEESALIVGAVTIIAGFFIRSKVSPVA